MQREFVSHNVYPGIGEREACISCDVFVSYLHVYVYIYDRGL